MIRKADDWPMYPESEGTGDKGIRIVEEIICDTYGWIFRRQEKNDLGIDAHIEIVTDERKSKGRLLALQIKCGTSFFKESNAEGFVFRGELKYFNYWTHHSLPVVLIICNPNNRKCLWVEVARSNVKVFDKYWKIVIPHDHSLNSTNKWALEQISNQLRHDDIVELSLFRYIYEKYGPGVQICPIIDEPRDFHGLSYIARLHGELIMVGFHLDYKLDISISDLEPYVQLYSYNMKVMGWDIYEKDAKLYLYLISESRDSLDLSGDVIDFLESKNFIKYFKLIYRPRSFYLLDSTEEEYFTKFD